MRNPYYRLLPDHSTVPCTMAELGLNGVSRIVKQSHTGSVWVSTVFLMIDHQYGSGPPVLFETMTFDPKGVGEERQYRYTTWEGAMLAHEAFVQEISDARRTFKRARTMAQLPTYEQVMERAGL